MVTNGRPMIAVPILSTPDKKVVATTFKGFNFGCALSPFHASSISRWSGVNEPSSVNSYSINFARGGSSNNARASSIFVTFMRNTGPF
jgi:hypothetical protein